MRSKDRDMMAEIVRFVDGYSSEHHTSPSVRAISEGVGLAKSSVHSYLKEMDSLGMVSYDGKSVVTPTMTKFVTGYFMAPVVGSIHCGEPGLEEEFIEEYVQLPESVFGRGDFYLLRAQGDSMTDAGIEEDDLVLIRRQQTANEGDIIVALDGNGENTLKLYSGYDRDKEKYILRYRNETAYPGRTIEVGDLRVQGTARYVIKALPGTDRTGR